MHPPLPLHLPPSPPPPLPPPSPPPPHPLYMILAINLSSKFLLDPWFLRGKQCIVLFLLFLFVLLLLLLLFLAGRIVLRPKLDFYFNKSPNVTIFRCIQVCLLEGLSIHWSIRPSAVCPSVHLSLRPSVPPSVCPSVRLSLCPWFISHFVFKSRESRENSTESLEKSR